MLATATESVSGPGFGASWSADVQALLDERHLAVWGDSSDVADRFVGTLQHHLGLQGDTEVWPIRGHACQSLEAVAREVELLAPSSGRDAVEPRIDGTRGITQALRRGGVDVFGRMARFRYIIWNDVDQLIERDAATFHALADAMMGVTAEAEYGPAPLRLITRVVFVGGESLRRAADPEGMLRRWRRAGAGRPFWAAVSGLQVPPICVHAVGRLMEGGVRPPRVTL